MRSFNLFNEKRKRVRQQDMAPTSIQPKNLGGIILSKPGDEVGDANTYSFTFGNGEQAVITHTLETNNESKLFAIVDMSLYVGTVTANNQLPGGSAVDETDYQIIGPMYDWGATDNKNVKVKLFILNISAGSVTINGRLVWRYISNDPNAEITTA